MAAPPTRDGPRVNEEIRIPQVRLIDQDGEMQGVMTAREAMQRAFMVGLDLVEISPNADPPSARSWISANSNTNSKKAERSQEKAKSHRDQRDQGAP